MAELRVKVRKLVVGPLEANCYLVWVEGRGSEPRTPNPEPQLCLLIDPGAEPEKILAGLAEERLRPETVVATHCHGDHIGAAEAILEAFPEAVWAAGAPEADWPARPAYNLSYNFGLALKVRPPTRLLRDNDEIILTAGTQRRGEVPVSDNHNDAVSASPGLCGEGRSLVLKVLAVPGHSPGSIALYCAQGQAVFTGDALFAGDIGRADLPGGDEAQLIHSVRTRILTLPEDTVVWPGHANRSRIGFERRNNPYVGGG